MTSEVFDYRKCWTTKDELAFISGIGTYNPTHSLVAKMGEAGLLRAYAEAANNRAQWGGVDKDIILTFVRSRIRALDAASQRIPSR